MNNPMQSYQPASSTTETSIIIATNRQAADLGVDDSKPRTKSEAREAAGEKIVLPKLRRLYWANLLLQFPLQNTKDENPGEFDAGSADGEAF